MISFVLFSTQYIVIIRLFRYALCCVGRSSYYHLLLALNCCVSCQFASLQVWCENVLFYSGTNNIYHVYMIVRTVSDLELFQVIQDLHLSVITLIRIEIVLLKRMKYKNVLE